LKVLFISTLSEDSNFGGALCSERNYKSLVDLFGKENVVTYYLRPDATSGIKKYLLKAGNILKGYMLALNDLRVNDIKRVISEDSITHIFLDSSLLGKLSKEIRKENKSIKIISFFHNFELKFLLEAVIRGRKFSRIFWIILGYVNEKMTCRYSNTIITLNKRDSNLVKKYYKRTSDFIIPISLLDRVENKNQLIRHSDKKKSLNLLFLGSNFFANVHGIQWFLNNVLPNVNANLTIIGKDIDKADLKYRKNDNKVEILSNVKDLTDFYYRADLVIAPIFLGSGMKVKIAEAMMFNRKVLGTSESFQGYEFINDIGLIANNANEFIFHIKNYNSNLEDSTPRQVFDNYYSYQSTLSKFKLVFN
jgi:hypothetical protein